MRARTGRIIGRARATSQIMGLVLFVVLLLGGSSLFLELDPLVLLATLAASHAVRTGLLLSVATLLLTLVLGRVFCGWLCPLGSINHALSSLSRRLGHGPGIVGAGLRRVKYVVLVIVLVLALLGTTTGLVLDPISLLTRSATVVVLPVAEHLGRSAAAAAGSPAAAEPGRRSHPVATPGIGPPPRAHAQVEPIGVVLLAILALNFLRPRFYCHALCPLGALLATASRFGALHITRNAACADCEACTGQCHGHGGPPAGHGNPECFTCFGCAGGCPSDAVQYGTAGAGRLAGAGDAARAPAPLPAMLGRRRALGAIAAGAFLAAMPPLSAGAGTRRRDFLRPPGARDEDSFLDRCVRCGACIQACPTHYVQPSGFQAGIAGLWTPVLDARLGYCEYDCTRCTEACPTGAIRSLARAEKQAWKLGTAVIDRSRCYTWADGFDCTACARACPVEGALFFREAEVWSHGGRRSRVRQLHVDPGLCNGCGACEYACPRGDRAGIVVGAEDEERHGGYPG